MSFSPILKNAIGCRNTLVRQGGRSDSPTAQLLHLPAGGNPWGAAQFGSCFFLITGFHGTHVTIGVIFLIAIARKVLRGDFDVERRGFFTSRKGHYEIVEITGLYWHFVDLVWVFIFAFFYLW